MCPTAWNMSGKHSRDYCLLSAQKFIYANDKNVSHQWWFEQIWCWRWVWNKKNKIECWTYMEDDSYPNAWVFNSRGTAVKQWTNRITGESGCFLSQMLLLSPCNTTNTFTPMLTRLLYLPYTINKINMDHYYTFFPKLLHH